MRFLSIDPMSVEVFLLTPRLNMVVNSAGLFGLVLGN